MLASVQQWVSVTLNATETKSDQLSDSVQLTVLCGALLRADLCTSCIACTSICCLFRAHAWPQHYREPLTDQHDLHLCAAQILSAAAQCQTPFTLPIAHSLTPSHTCPHSGLHHAMSNGAAAQAWGQQGMCPSFHQIHGPCGNTSVRGRFGAIVCLCDPSMPLRVGGLWHLFVDGAGSQPGWYWHFTSSDTLHWANVSNDNTTNTFTGWTGAATVTPEGAIVALNPNGDGCGDDVSPCGIGRSVALSSAMTEWSVSICGNPSSEVIAKPAGVTGGFRDVTRAFEIDGAWFVLVGTGCKAVNATCKPGELGGQVRVYRATDAMLAAFEPEGGVLWATSTSLGHIQKGLRGQVLAWNSTSVPEEFHECPDVYRLSNDSNDWLLAGSFMPSHNARYWVGTMEIPPGERLPKFIPRTSWLWDFGSYCPSDWGSRRRRQAGSLWMERVDVQQVQRDRLWRGV